MEVQETLEKWESIASKCFSDLVEKYPNLSESQIAQKINIPRATFNRIKNEQKLPRIENIIKVIIGSGNINF